MLPSGRAVSSARTNSISLVRSVSGKAAMILTLRCSGGVRARQYLEIGEIQGHIDGRGFDLLETGLVKKAHGAPRGWCPQRRLASQDRHRL